jgi:hypothetical protein
MILEKILNSKKIRYNILNDFFPKYLPEEKDDVVFYIDIYSLLNSIYNPRTIEHFNTMNNSEKFLITVELLNIAAHYRRYFWSRHQTYTTFYFYYSTRECDKLKEINREYKKDYYAKRINDDNPEFSNINSIMEKNIKLSKTIGNYIPNVYFINTKEFDPEGFPRYFITNYHKENQLNVILNNTKLSWQNALLDDTIVLTCKQDNSEVLEKEDIIPKLTEKDYDEYTFIPELLPIIFSLVGYKRYNIQGLNGYGYIRSSNKIQKWIDDEKISNIEYLDINDFIGDLEDEFVDNQKERLRKSFKQISHREINNLMNEKMKASIDNQIVNKVDGQALRYINDKYFSGKYRTPLKLEEIFEGEEYI